MIRIEDNEDGYKVTIKGKTEEVVFQIAYVMKQLFDDLKSKGATDTDLTIYACAIQNFALGNIPEEK